MSSIRPLRSALIWAGVFLAVRLLIALPGMASGKFGAGDLLAWLIGVLIWAVALFLLVLLVQLVRRWAHRRRSPSA